MTRLASRFGAVNTIRRDRPLTNDELAPPCTKHILGRETRFP
ncbi:Uncharacterised protein [Serratia fonticola]|uniref:Uncharacterized protein n=1 Tax=Serratia fonticola TaxID=47917 RepID=A0A4U9WE51_SERFO|nr:Uncharacterised protein [Serratia fonticola]